MIILSVLAFALGVSPTVPPPKVEDLTSVFERFCLETRADRAAFDAQISRADGLEKVSAPLLPSGFEVHRRWKLGNIQLSFTDAPPPTPRMCAVTLGARGGFDGQAIATQIAKVGRTVLQQSENNRWIGMMPSGETLLINNRQNPDGFGDVEIVLLP